MGDLLSKGIKSFISGKVSLQFQRMKMGLFPSPGVLKFLLVITMTQ